jgi:hypothetical protein
MAGAPGTEVPAQVRSARGDRGRFGRLEADTRIAVVDLSAWSGIRPWGDAEVASA